MNKTILSCVFFVMLLGLSSVVLADCEKDGVTYPVGTEIGGFVCTEDGTWEKK